MTMPGKKFFAFVGVCAAATMAASCESYSSYLGDITMSDEESLATIIASRSDEDRERDEWRNPKETLEFFQVEPDDFVVEVLPGGGWYTRIVAPYVAEKGRYAAVDYPYAMYPLILPNPTEEILAQVKAWPKTFPDQVAQWAETKEPVTVFEFGEVPGDIAGEVDVLLVVRAMHNFNRAGGTFRDDALRDMAAMVKPGGVVGVVQHRSNDGAEGAAMDGSLGYLDQQLVIDYFEDAGFVFEAASEVNANPADQPGLGEFVWRLPPTYGLGDTNRAEYTAIGESDRMTLRFRKPAQ